MVAGFGSILTGLNFIVTVHTMRAPGMGWFQLPLFIWSHYATSLILVLATPILAITLLLVGIERVWQYGIFEPSLGGDPLLFQHLFWFYSHPAVYIMVLPAMGVVSEIVPCFARKHIFGYHFVAFASLAIATYGFLVWGHHMFVSGQSPYASLIFSALSFLVAVPSAIKVFNWTATLHKGYIHLRTPMLYALGFIGLFVIGGLTGLFLASTALDVHVHDTYFVVSHFHYIMVGGAVMGYLGAIHFWWPKMSGRRYPEGWGIFAAILLFVGFNLTFFPQFLLGYGGMVRRIAEYAGIPGPECYVNRRGFDIGRRVCCRWLICCGLCDGRRTPDRTRGLRPGSSGKPVRRRPSTTSWPRRRLANRTTTPKCRAISRGADQSGNAGRNAVRRSRPATGGVRAGNVGVPGQ